MTNTLKQLRRLFSRNSKSIINFNQCLTKVTLSIIKFVITYFFIFAHIAWFGIAAHQLWKDFSYVQSNRENLAEVYWSFFLFWFIGHVLIEIANILIRSYRKYLRQKLQHMPATFWAARIIFIFLILSMCIVWSNKLVMESYLEVNQDAGQYQHFVSMESYTATAEGSFKDRDQVSDLLSYHWEYTRSAINCYKLLKKCDETYSIIRYYREMGRSKPINPWLGNINFENTSYSIVMWDTDKSIIVAERVVDKCEKYILKLYGNSASLEKIKAKYKEGECVGDWIREYRSELEDSKIRILK